MIDPFKTGPSGGSLTVPTQAEPTLPDFGPPPDDLTGDAEHPVGEMPWDTLGRLVFGTTAQGGVLSKHVGLEGLTGPIRTIGEATRNAVTAGGFGVNAAIEGGAHILGAIPSGQALEQPGYHTVGGNNLGPTQAFDPNIVNQYGEKKGDAFSLLMDLRDKHANLPAQFEALGLWQKEHDPEGFVEWETALKNAREAGTNAGDVMSNFVREWGTTYSDFTPNGLTGLYDVMPELAFTGSGSLGQGLSDALSHLMVLQRKAERGAASIKGGLLAEQGKIDPRTGKPVEGFGGGQRGRIYELRAEVSRGHEITPIEQAALDGLDNYGWSEMHAYNFLIAHGQGFSADPKTQLALQFALDPITVGSLGAADAALVGERAASYGSTVNSTSRILGAYQKGAKAIGTTVAAVRDSEMGPAWKLGRTIIDPFSAFGGGPHGQAKADVLAATGLQATKKAYGFGAFAGAARQAKKWGVSTIWDSALATTSANFARKWTGSEIVAALHDFGHLSSRHAITEETLDAAARNAPKDAASRMAGFVSRHMASTLTSSEMATTAERVAKMVSKPLAEVKDYLAKAGPNEVALWHAQAYSDAWAKFRTAMARVPVEQWGKLAKRIDDLVILNPNQLDKVAAEDLYEAIGKAKGKQRIELWNAATKQYSILNDLGSVSPTGYKAMSKRLESLQKLIDQGELHTAVTPSDKLPKQFVNEFIDAHIGTDGEPLYRLGWKPNAEQATGMISDAEGNLIPRYEPNISNVVAATPTATKSGTPVADILGRITPSAVRDSRVAGAAAKMRDDLDVLLQTAGDAVSGERLMLSMEQDFTRRMIKGGYSRSQAKNVFRVSRDIAQKDTVSLAGLTPDKFWQASESALGDVVDAARAKREVFGYLLQSAGGDVRLMGLSSGMTQRIRAGLVVRGIDPNNWLGVVTVQMYNNFRYVLNPTFFLQAISDAPFFNVYRGVLPPLGRSLEAEGSAAAEMAAIQKAVGHTQMVNDLSMDFTERTKMIGWQQRVVKNLDDMPGLKAGIAERTTNWAGRMMVENELAFINSKLGESIFDAIETTKQEVLAQRALATSDEARAVWDEQLSQIPMLDSIREQVSNRLGRAATDEEVGRAYVAELIEDSRLEHKTPEGLIEYKRVNSKAEYHVPTDYGELGPLDLDYLAEAVAWPNVHSATDLRVAISAEGPRSADELRDTMKALDMHPDHIDRAINSLTFQWDRYFKDLGEKLGMSRYEVQGIEDMVRRSAKLAGMSPNDYITQVLPMTSPRPIEAGGVLKLNSKGAIGRDVVDVPPGLAPGDMPRFLRDGEPGFHPISETMTDGAEPEQVFTMRGPDGKAQGYLALRLSEPGSTVVDNLHVYVKPEFRRQGVATQMYDEARKAGYDMERASGKTVTAEGRAFTDKFWSSRSAAPTVTMAGVDANLSFALDVMRASARGQAGLDDMVKLVTGHLQPSSKLRLLDYFEEQLSGSNGLIQKANELVNTLPEGSPNRLAAEQHMRNLNDTLTDLRGGWGKVQDDQFRDLIVRRAGGEAITDPEVERAARYFSAWMKSVAPEMQAGSILKDIIDNIPVEGASAHDFTQGVLLKTLHQNIRLAEKDAIRLAHAQTERTVLSRSLNHPIFGIYPTSYFWGKVIPETFRFIGYSPFGLNTTLGAEAFYKVQQSVALQSQYDPGMADLYDKLGKSAVLQLISMISPGMVWEDMKSNLPVYLREAAQGEDPWAILQDQFDTMSPSRWVKYFAKAAGEIGKGAGEVVDSLAPDQKQELNDITQSAPTGGAPAPVAPDLNEPVKGTGLAPLLTNEMSDLQAILAGGS